MASSRSGEKARDRKKRHQENKEQAAHFDVGQGREIGEKEGDLDAEVVRLGWIEENARKKHSCKGEGPTELQVEGAAPKEEGQRGEDEDEKKEVDLLVSAIKEKAGVCRDGPIRRTALRTEKPSSAVGRPSSNPQSLIWIHLEGIEASGEVVDDRYGALFQKAARAVRAAVVETVPGAGSIDFLEHCHGHGLPWH